jgi:hypothetical protein
MSLMNVEQGPEHANEEDLEARRERAASIYEQVERLPCDVPDEENDEAEAENPREFIERKMREERRRSETQDD